MTEPVRAPVYYRSIRLAEQSLIDSGYSHGNGAGQRWTKAGMPSLRVLRDDSRDVDAGMFYVGA